MSINNLTTRLNYRGGSSQVDRMNADKLRSLKYAIQYSYQSATAVLLDGRAFKCLINPDKLNEDADNKILSIPFSASRWNGDGPVLPPDEPEIDDDDSGGDVWEDMDDLISTFSRTDSSGDSWNGLEETEKEEINIRPSINKAQEENVGIKEGDVIYWQENKTYWLVYLQKLEETAYFRADLRRCRHQIKLDTGKKYWAYVRGPIENNLNWVSANGINLNQLNYTLTAYVTSNAETKAYFKRFKTVSFNDQTWEVQATDSISTPGIITVALKEKANNTIETDIDVAVSKAEQTETPREPTTLDMTIYGLQTVYPYEVHTYTVYNDNNDTGGRWIIRNASRDNLVKLSNETGLSVDVYIVSGKRGSFTLVYQKDFSEASMDITIESL